MSVEEELREHAEHAQNPFDKHVAATMAIIAAALAVVSVLGHIMTTEELLKQQKASDQWSYYQAKSIRRYVSEVARDTFATMKDSKESEQYAKNAEKYKKDDEEITKEAKALEERKRPERPQSAASALRRGVSGSVHRLRLARDSQQATAALVPVHRRRAGRGGDCAFNFAGQLAQSRSFSD